MLWKQSAWVPHTDCCRGLLCRSDNILLTSWWKILNVWILTFAGSFVLHPYFVSQSTGISVWSCTCPSLVVLLMLFWLCTTILRYCRPFWTTFIWLWVLIRRFLTGIIGITLKQTNHWAGMQCQKPAGRKDLMKKKPCLTFSQTNTVTRNILIVVWYKLECVQNFYATNTNTFKMSDSM